MPWLLVTVREDMRRACSDSVTVHVISRTGCSAYITCVNFCHLIPDVLPFWIAGPVTTKLLVPLLTIEWQLWKALPFS
jgi:hypothetical protein